MTLKNTHKIEGSGGGGSDSPDPPYEAPNTLRSRATARVLDVVSEGEIEGLIDGLKSVYLDEVAVQNSDDSYNFDGVSITERKGLNDQDPMYVFADGAPSETYLGYELEQNVARSRSITGWTGDYLKLKFRIPSLVRTDQSTGDLLPDTVRVNVEYSVDGGAYELWGTVVISGKTVSEYERQIRIENLTGYSSIVVRCTKTTGDSDAYHQRTIYWYSYTEVVAERLIYPDTAYYGLKVNAELFGNHIPNRAYHIKGIKVQVPSNYNPIVRTYGGVWDGTFQTAWTDNPAWIFYDLLTNTRYGLGVSSTYSDSLKWLLYTIAQYCDNLVDDGYGGTEPRYSCNCVINTREEAFHIIHTMASIFNAMPFWGPGQVYIAQDVDADPSRIVTPANVEGGKFNYEGTGIKARHTVALVTWNDPNDFYRQAQEVVESPTGIERYGWREIEVTAYGCTSRGQAHRTGKWILESDLSQKETVSYTAGWDHVDCLPGEIIQIADPSYGEVRHGGRIVTPGTDSITIDAEFEFDETGTYTFSVVMEDLSIETVSIVNPGTTTATFNLAESLSAVPKTGAVWLITETSDLVPRKWRVVSVNETSKGKFGITAVYHDEDKYDRIDTPTFDPVVDPIIPIGMPDPPTNFTTQEYTYMSGQSHLFGLMLGWEHPGDPRISYYQLQWRTEDSAYLDLANPYDNSYDFKPVVAGSYYFRVRSVSLSGWSSWLESGEVVVTATVAALPAVTNLQVVGGGTTWNTPDLEIEWDSILDTYFSAALSTVLRDYRVDIYTPSDELLRTEFVDRSNPFYVYTRDKNISDSDDGEGNRTVKITVRARDVYENLGTATTVSFSNPAPDMSTYTLTITDIFKGVLVTWDNWSEPNDMRKYGIYAGTNQSLVEALDSSTSQGEVAAGTKRFIVANLTAGSTYHVVVVPYDTFGIGTQTSSGTGDPTYIGTSDLDEELSSNLEITDSLDTSDLSELYDGVVDSGGVQYGVQTWAWVQYSFPVETLIDRVYFAATNHQLDVYIAVSEDETTWTFYKADADHTIDTAGRLSLASNESDAQTNYFRSETANKVYLPFPNMVIGRYARIYFRTIDAAFYFREIVFVREIVSEQIAADAIVARHLSSQIVDTEHLVAGSVDATIIAANSITANHIQADAINGDHISAASELVLDEGGKATFGDDNIIIDTNPAGGGGNIIVAPDGGITGQHYALLENGDITFYYYDLGTDQHYEYKSLKRVESGTANSGETVVIPGYWKSPPSINLYPKQMPVYSSAYPNRDQKIIMEAEDLQLVSGTEDRWQFDANCYLALAAGTLGEDISQYLEDYVRWDLGNPGPLTFSTHVPNSPGDITYLTVNAAISCYTEQSLSYCTRFYATGFLRLYYQLPGGSWTYQQSSTYTLTTALTPVQFHITGLSGIGSGGFYVRAYFGSTQSTYFYRGTGGCSNNDYIKARTYDYLTNLTGSQTLLSNGVLGWQATGE
ncbi:MAG: phage tail protein [Halobacteriota archaeon]|nr:phage tail protein [Halobacteriota archaeon]